MTLSEFIAAENARRPKPRTQADWATSFGISRSYFAEILSGSKEPGRETIRKIEAATNGAVPAGSWFPAPHGGPLARSAPSASMAVDGADSPAMPQRNIAEAH